MNYRILICLCVILFAGHMSHSQSTSLTQIADVSEEGRWVFFKKGLNLNANDVLAIHKDAFGLSQKDELRLVSSQTDEIGFRHDKYQLYHQGIEVEHAIWILHSRDNYPIKANGFLPLPLSSNFSINSSLTSAQALDKALESLGDLKYAWENAEMEEMIKHIRQQSTATYYPTGELLITDRDFDFEKLQPRLAYKFEILSLDPVSDMLIYIDANSGEVIKQLENLHTTHTHNETGTAQTAYSGEQSINTTKTPEGYILREESRNGGSNIWTLDANNSTSLANATDFLDDDNNWDDFEEEVNRAATDAHYMAQFTYDFFNNTFQREGYDGEAGLVLSYMHYGSPNFFNAFYSPAGGFMGFGDGNGKPLSSPDIFAHEFVHGVTRNSSNLFYANESGALNESFSDIFGNTLEYFANPQKFTWYMGEEVGSFRNMANPHEFGDPKIYKGRFWFQQSSDGGGVHTNSGVQNYWYYLVVEGGQGFDDIGRPINVKGIGFEKAIRIAYRNLTVYLTPTSQYEDAKNGAIQAAIDLFGECSPEYLAVVNAWNTVGLSSPALPNEFELTALNEFGICDDFEEEELVFTINYTGCDTFQGGPMTLAYALPDFSAEVSEAMVIPQINPRGSFTYTFQQKLNVTEIGRFEIEGSINSPSDPYPYNDQLSRTFSKTVGLKGVESFSFSEGSTLITVKDSININSGEESKVKVLPGLGKDKGGGLSIEGGRDFTYLLSESIDPFVANPSHTSSLCMCVDARRSLDLQLYFDRRQVYSSYLEETFGVEPELAARVVNNLRLMINGEEVSRYVPQSQENDTFTTEIIDLNAYAGSLFDVCFEGVVHLNVNTDDVGNGDRIFLDNIRFEGLKSSPQEGGVEGPESEITYWYYPNPTNGSLNFAFESEDESLFEIEIFDHTGRLVQSLERSANIGVNGMKLDISSLPEGMYLLKIRNGEKEGVAKIVKE